MSCQEEEIIPIGAEDLALESSKPLDGVDVEVQDLIVSENGEILGSFDREINPLDRDGHLISTSNNRDNYSSLRHKIIFYQHSHFRGDRIAFQSTGNDLNVANLKDHGWNDRISSLVLPQGCYITAWEHANYSGRSYYATVRNVRDTKYVPSISLNDKFSSFKVRCRPDINTAGSFCGYVWEHTNYRGNNLPVFQDDFIRLTDYTWWDNEISSISSNAYSNCDGIGLWEHGDMNGSNRDQRRLWRTRNQDDSSIHNDDLGDRATVIESRRTQEGYESNNIGIMLNEVGKQKGWKNNFGCNYADEVCSNRFVNAGTGGGVLMLSACSWYAGTAVIADIGAVIGVLLAPETGGVSAAVAAGLGTLGTAQGIKAMLCFGAAGLTYAAGKATCTTALTNWCIANTED